MPSPLSRYLAHPTDTLKIRIYNPVYVRQIYNDIEPQTNPFNFPKNSNQLTERCKLAVTLARLECEYGVTEHLGTNDGLIIREYKNSNKGNNLPWCAYFISYIYGKGQDNNNLDTFGVDPSTQNIRRKAEREGFYARKNTGYTPKMGDLAMWKTSENTGHVGIVVEVYPDGSFDVIEGNSKNNKVELIHYKSQNQVSPAFHGFVKMNEWTNTKKNLVC